MSDGSFKQLPIAVIAGLDGGVPTVTHTRDYTLVFTSEFFCSSIPMALQRMTLRHIHNTF